MPYPPQSSNIFLHLKHVGLSSPHFTPLERHVEHPVNVFVRLIFPPLGGMFCAFAASEFGSQLDATVQQVAFRYRVKRFDGQGKSQSDLLSWRICRKRDQGVECHGDQGTSLFVLRELTAREPQRIIARDAKTPDLQQSVRSNKCANGYSRLQNWLHLHLSFSTLFLIRIIGAIAKSG
jgi:hypothetical protein